MVDRLSPAAVFGRLRAPGGRLRRSVMAQRPAIRWSLATAAVSVAIGLSAVGYWGVTSLSTVGGRHYLVSGRSFSSDDLITICQALDKQRVPYHVDDQRRIEVGADQFDQAAEVVSKLDLGQPSDRRYPQAHQLLAWHVGAAARAGIQRTSSPGTDP